MLGADALVHLCADRICFQFRRGQVVLADMYFSLWFGQRVWQTSLHRNLCALVVPQVNAPLLDEPTENLAQRDVTVHSLPFTTMTGT